MRCHICNASLGEPIWNNDHGDFEPCGTCLEVINDLVASYKDRASAGEDELGDDLDLLGLLASDLEPEFL